MFKMAMGSLLKRVSTLFGLARIEPSDGSPARARTTAGSSRPCNGTVPESS